MTPDNGTTTSGSKGTRAARVETLVMQATREILAEGGVKELTVEGVARRSGVAKTTIYRRWRSKEDLALAVVLEMTRSVVATPAADDIRSSLVGLLDGAVTILRTTPMGRVMRGLASDLATDPVLQQAYEHQVISLRQARLAELVEGGVRRGELVSECDVDLLHDLLFGPVYYRLLTGDGTLPQDFAFHIVDAVLPALRPT